VENKWEEYKRDGNDERLRQLIETFWFILQTNALIYIRDSIESLNPDTISLESIDWQTPEGNYQPDAVLELLSLFKQADDDAFRMAVDLILQYLEKRPKALPEGLKLFSEEFGFTRHSHIYSYASQHVVIDALISRVGEGRNALFSKLFIELCKYYLKTEFRGTEGNKKGITIHRFNLLAIPPTFELREKVWSCLFRLYDDPALEKEVFSVLRHYCQSGYDDVPEITKKDAALLFPFIQAKLDSEKFAHCMMVQDFCSLMDRRQIAKCGEIEERFNSDSYKLYKLLAFDFADKDKHTSIQDFEKLKGELIKNHTQNYNFEDYKHLIASCLEIKEEIGNTQKMWDLAKGLCKVFDALAERDSLLHSEVIHYYLSLKDPLNGWVRAFPLVQKLLERCGPDKGLEIIESTDFPTKRQWLFAYYQSLKPADIKPEDLEGLYLLYRQAELREMPHDLDYILKYQNQESSAMMKVVEILIERTVSDSTFGHGFSGLFIPNTEVNKQLVPLFRNALHVLKKAYLLHERVDHNADFDGHTMNVILDLDPGIINEHIDLINADKTHPGRHDDARDYNFLWNRQDVETIMVSIIEHLLSKERSYSLIRDEYLERLFCVNERNPSPPEIIKKQDRFLKNLIQKDANNREKMLLVFCVISYFEPKRRLKLIASFLENNKNYNDFESLPLEPSSWGWSGSAVPVISGRIEYWQSLLPLCNSVDLLDHKAYIERHIQNLQRSLDAEKKLDFMKD